MKINTKIISILIICYLSSGFVYDSAANSQSVPPPLAIEDFNKIETLPSQFPEHWLLVHDIAFTHVNEGRVLVIDASENRLSDQIKGMFSASLVAAVIQSLKRNEIYVAESFYSRLNRGERTDVVTIYDPQTLSVIEEIILPGKKRLTMLPQRDSITLINNDKYLLISNFNPASSVSVVDLENRVISDVFDTAGCVLLYPTGQKSITSLCSNGGLLVSTIDEQGKLIGQTRTPSFFNTDTNPLFERPALINSVAYFPSFAGDIYPVDLHTKEIIVKPSWPALTEQEKKENWRPGGLVLIDSDELGNFYLLMHPDGKDGSQNSGGAEVWVFSAQHQKRLRRIELKTWGISVAVSAGKQPLLVVSNAEMNLDIYDALTGNYMRTIENIGLETPLLVRGIK